METSLILGSAMWGWSVNAATAFQLLDYWYDNGYKTIDAATNYPINKNPEDFRSSEKILTHWIRSNNINDLEIIMKVGSLDNMRTPDCNLQKSFLLMSFDHYQNMLGTNLHTFMIHWDNRDDIKKIEETFEALDFIQKNHGIKIGLSGIKLPQLYHDINKNYGIDFDIQIKHNIFNSDYQKYLPFHGKKRFITYGINAGGVKLNPDAYTEKSSYIIRGGDIFEEPPMLATIREIVSIANKKLSLETEIKNFNQLGMLFAAHSPDIKSILIGSSSVEQLHDSFSFYNKISTTEYTHLYELIVELQTQKDL